MQVVAVISDIHANPTALKAALLQAQPYDRLICLGDLLSYGVEIEETLDLLEKSGAELILGNHDQLYLEMIDGNKEYYDSLPKWMQDMADFTYKKLDHKRFKQLVFKKEITIENKIYLSHANPWGDWGYIKTEEEFQKAADYLKKSGYKCGIFGHSHRASINNKSELKVEGSTDQLILNPGSIGQPRGTNSSFLKISYQKNKIWAEIIQVEYDIEYHVNTILISTLFPKTKDKLVAYFRKTNE